MEIQCKSSECTLWSDIMLSQLCNLLAVSSWTSYCTFLCSSVQFSHSVVSNSLWPHESQHARLPCPLPASGVYPNPCPSSQQCHPAISSSVVLFSSPPIPPSIRVFSNESTLRMSWPKYWSFSFSIFVVSNTYFIRLLIKPGSQLLYCFYHSKSSK